MPDEQILGISLNKLNLFVNALTALGTFSAVVAALYIAFRNERTRIKVYCQPVFMNRIQEIGHIVQCNGLKIYMKNVGTRTSGIERVELRGGLFRFWPFIKRR